MRRFKRLQQSAGLALPMPGAVLTSLLVMPLALGCGSDSLKPPPPPEPSELYWDLVLNHHAVLLATAAPYDTLTLVATPRNFRGEALASLPQPQFSSDDIEHVTVSSDGVLHAIAPTPPGTLVQVTATLVAGNLKYMDRMVVRVVSGESPPALASLSVHPLPPDSAKVAVSNPSIPITYYDTLPVRAIDAAGMPISTIPGEPNGVVPVDIRAADTAMIPTPLPTQLIDVYSLSGRNIIVGHQLGRTKIYATTTALGVTVADTLEYRVGWPLGGLVQVLPLGALPVGYGMPQSNIFNAPDITIAAGGFVVWANNVDTMLQSDIHFADADVPNVAPFAPPPAFAPAFLGYVCSQEEVPMDCTNGGNALLGPGGYRWALRIFPVPGTYEYTSTKHPGSGGRIVVVDER